MLPDASEQIVYDCCYAIRIFPGLEVALHKNHYGQLLLKEANSFTLYAAQISVWRMC
jgi:hypothetical protein